MSLDEAARILGLHRKTLRRLIKAGDVAAVRLGRRILLEQAELRRVVRDSRLPAAA